MSLRARIKTLAGQQWGAGRLYSELVLRLLAERGIEMPTQRVSYVENRRSSVMKDAGVKAKPQAV
jgi:small conductance mechanosensitive channel